MQHFNAITFIDDMASSIITRSLKLQFIRWVGYTGMDGVMTTAIRGSIQPLDDADYSALYRSEMLWAWAYESLPRTFDLLQRNAATGEWRSVPTTKEEWMVDTLNSVWAFRGLGLAQNDAPPAQVAEEMREHLAKMGFGEGVAAGAQRLQSKDDARALRNQENKPKIFAFVLRSIKHPASDEDCAAMDKRDFAGFIGKTIAKLEAWGNGAARRATATRNKVWSAEAAAEATEWASIIRLAEQALEDAQARADENEGIIDGEPDEADRQTQFDIDAAFAKAMNG